MGEVEHETLVATWLHPPQDPRAGWAPLSLCLHAVPNSDEVLYTGVWVRWSGGVSRPAISYLPASEQGETYAWLDAEARGGRFPFLVGAAHTAAGPRFSVFTSSSARPAHRKLDDGVPVRRSSVLFSLPAGVSWNDLFGFVQGAGMGPEWVAPYGVEGDGNFALVLREQPSKGGPGDPGYSPGWAQRNLNILWESEDPQQANAALISAFAYPRVLGRWRSPAGKVRHFMLHESEPIEGNFAVFDIREDRLELALRDLADLDLWPLSVMGNDAGPGQRFNVVVAGAGHLSPPKRWMRITRLPLGGLPADASEAQSARLSEVEVSGELAGSRWAAYTKTQRRKQRRTQRSAARATAWSAGRGFAARASRFSRSASLEALSDDAGQAPALAPVAPVGPFTAVDAPFTPLGAQVARGLPPPLGLQTEANPTDPGDIVASANDRFKPADDFVMALMRRHSVRAAQLAVAHQGALVYAAAYTWAPLSYPLTHVAQRMRIGSIAKVFASVALLRMAEGANAAEAPIDLFDLGSGNLAVLVDVPYVIADAGWITRTAAQLACHVGFFDEEVALAAVDPWRVIQDLYAQGVPADELVPLSALHLSDYMLKTMPPSTPTNMGYFEAIDGQRVWGGTLTTTGLQVFPRYSNFGFNRIGDIVASQSRQEDYFKFLREEVLDPLGVPESRVGLTEPRAAGARWNTAEVRYHARNPVVASTSRSYRVDDGTIGPAGWGALHYDGTFWEIAVSGGFLSLAALDVARLYASFDLPTHPVLKNQASVDMLVRDTYAKDRTLGFFVPAPGFLWHNGSYPGTSAMAFRRDGLVGVLTLNTDIHGSLTEAHGFELETILRAIRDGEGFPPWDLFQAPGVLTHG